MATHTMEVTNTMQRRHFLVQERDSSYELKEIAPAIAHGIALFGTTTGQYRAIESIRWTFYFMNCKISSDRADDIAAELTEDFLQGRR
ncbi:MAG: hypothetical protein AAFV98_01560 [Chloroflexota bacterium]